MTPARRLRPRAVASAAIAVAMLLFGLQQVGDVGKAWALLSDLRPADLAVLSAATVLNLVTYWLLLMAALPGLTIGQAAASSQASTAVSNVLPAGAAVGAGLTWAMYRGYGFTRDQVSSALSLTGFWNTAVKLATPPVAMVVLAAGDDGPPRGVAVLSAAVLVAVAVVSKWLITSERALQWLVRSAVAVPRVRRRIGARELRMRFDRTRRELIELVRERWAALSVSAVASHLGLFAVLVVSARVVGVRSADVSLAEVLTAFALVRVALIVPITPGGAGIAEVGYAALLAAAGADPAAAVAAVVLFRSLTWLLPIATGGVVYLAWLRRPQHGTSRGVAT